MDQNHQFLHAPLPPLLLKEVRCVGLVVLLYFEPSKFFYAMVIIFDLTPTSFITGAVLRYQGTLWTTIIIGTTT